MPSQHTKVCVRHSTHIIKPAESKLQTGRINLTPWDLELLHLQYIQKGLLFRKPDPQQENESTLIHHIKQSLERTLNFFPLLAGRLLATPVDGGAAACYSIDCCNAGAVFIHATAALTIANIVDPPYVPEAVHSFFPLTGNRNYDGVTQPLLAVQVTELVDGLFIGCSINHVLVDGTSFWHFFNSWAEISHRKLLIDNLNNPISKLPIFDREIFSSVGLTGASSIKIDQEHLILDAHVAKSDCGLMERVFHFTRDSVAKLKARANQEMNEISKGNISSLQAIIAHVWRSIIRCRSATNLDTDQETTFEIPMGARQRLNPPLAEEYFGNAVFPGTVTLEVCKLLKNGLGWTAWQINEMVASKNRRGQVEEFYEGWIKKPTFLNLDGLPRNHFVLISSPRFDLYGNDFGWGKPVAMRSGKSNRFEGRITISAGLEKGSLDIEACLSQDTLCALGEDAKFTKFVDF